MEKEKTPQEDLKLIKDIYSNIVTCKICPCEACKEDKRLAKEIAERNEFEGGCGTLVIEDDDGDRYWYVKCGEYSFLHGDNLFCFKCQARKEIQEIWERIK